MSESDGDYPALSGLSQQLAILNEIAQVATLDVDLRPALQRISDILHARCKWQFIACFSLERDEGDRALCEALVTSLPTPFQVGRARQLRDDVMGRAVESGAPALLDTTGRAREPAMGVVPNVASQACIPIALDGEVIALLVLASARRAGFRDLLPLLTTVAGQIAGIIASARRLAAKSRHASLTEMMSQVSRLAMEATELPEILSRIVHYIGDKFPVDVASILLLDESGKRFVVEVYSGSLELRTPEGEEWSIDVGVSGRCVRTGQPQLVVDATSDPDYVPGNDAIQSEYIVPICFADRILGVLNLESVDRDTFTPSVQSVFRSLADQIAGAVNLSSVNQRLVETNRIVEERTRELEQTNRRLQEVNAELESLSSLDGLTGMTNRRRFDEILDTEWRRAFRGNRPMSAMLADVDFFKAINDTRGHQYGDDCLRKIADTLKDGLRRAADIIARYGGEEFVVLLPETTAHHAMQHADRLRKSIQALEIPHPASPVCRYVTISIGVATVWPQQVQDADLLIQTADMALYEAKRNGRNRVAGRALEKLASGPDRQLG